VKDHFSIKRFLRNEAVREKQERYREHDNAPRRKPFIHWQKQTETERLLTLTPAQKRVWLYIASYQHKHAMPPTMREIAEYYNYSGVGGVVWLLSKLQEKGIITRKANGKRKARGYKLFVWPPPDKFIDVDNQK
jgi:DNA-binding MarR family transcriptional regulator